MTFLTSHVLQAERKTDGALAAAKIIDVKDESELDDFMVEIDILSECKHNHVVGMYEAYYHENKLWVSSAVKGLENSFSHGFLTFSPVETSNLSCAEPNPFN